MQDFNLSNYLNKSVNNIVKSIVKETIKNPRTSVFMSKFIIYHKKAQLKRENEEKNGQHIPPFLIASITNHCNLHCAGCYARENKSCDDLASSDVLLKAVDFSKIFSEAENLGIEFILLAGGEPFLRRDVIETASQYQNIIFPIFTNGTLISNDYLELLNKKRNLIPVLSIEGKKTNTDNRRGEGIFNTLNQTMKELKKRGIIFACSITVTKNNMQEVLSEDFVDDLVLKGVKTIVYVEYVPTNVITKNIALDDNNREIMNNKLKELRSKRQDILFISFPGDEKNFGGCLAAGRGFFHINPTGAAEPCPFSPYSDINVKDTSLKEAINSKLFKALNNNGNLNQEHIGGCSLFEQREEVEALVKK